MHFIDQCVIDVLIWLPLGCGDSGYHHMLGVLPDFKYWSLSLKTNLQIN